jgi:hypothetical protein
MLRPLLVLFLATASLGAAAALPALSPSAVRIPGGAKSNQDALKKSLAQHLDSTMALQISSLAWFGYALESAYPKYFSEKYTVAKKYEGNGQFW